MIQIDELQISMPGATKEAGAELGRQVAEKLATAMPEKYAHQHIPELRLQLQSIASSTDIPAMADRIVGQIIGQIKLAAL